MEAKAGTRVRCVNCGSELIVITVQDLGAPELSCCDQPVQQIAPGGPASERKA